MVTTNGRTWQRGVGRIWNLKREALTPLLRSLTDKRTNIAHRICSIIAATTVPLWRSTSRCVITCGRASRRGALPRLVPGLKTVDRPDWPRAYTRKCSIRTRTFVVTGRRRLQPTCCPMTVDIYYTPSNSATPWNDRASPRGRKASSDRCDRYWYYCCYHLR